MKQFKNLLLVLFWLLVGIPVSSTLLWLAGIFGLVAFIGKKLASCFSYAVDWLVKHGKADRMDFLQEFIE
jgi:hypothetical protein